MESYTHVERIPDNYKAGDRFIQVFVNIFAVERGSKLYKLKLGTSKIVIRGDSSFCREPLPETPDTPVTLDNARMIAREYIKRHYPGKSVKIVETDYPMHDELNNYTNYW